MKNAKQINITVYAEFNGYLNLSKQSPKYEKSNTKILVTKRKPFRNRSKSKISLGQPNKGNHYQKIIQRL
jgi:hypothetical protein